MKTHEKHFSTLCEIAGQTGKRNLRDKRPECRRDQASSRTLKSGARTFGWPYEGPRPKVRDGSLIMPRGFLEKQGPEVEDEGLQKDIAKHVIQVGVSNIPTGENYQTPPL